MRNHFIGCFYPGFWICLQGCRGARLKGMLLIKKSAHRLHIPGACLRKIKVAGVDRIGVARDQQRGVAAKSSRAAHAFAPKHDMHPWRHFEKFLREAGAGIKRGGRFPRMPADVVLPGGKAHLVIGLRGGETRIAPGPRQLAGQPGMARLRNGDDVKAILAKQHHFSSWFLTQKNEVPPPLFLRPAALPPALAAIAAEYSPGIRAEPRPESHFLECCPSSLILRSLHRSI